MKQYYLYILAIVLCFGCETKEGYLSDYQKFMSKVKKEWTSYSEEDWERKTALFEKYNTQYYKKFKRQLTTEENVRVHRFAFVFNFYKGDITFNKFFRGDYDTFLNNLSKATLDKIITIFKEIAIGAKDIRDVGLINIISQLIE
ncbi:MAG: DUF6565 domain-containing protein [Bacteroidota bacterium]